MLTKLREWLLTGKGAMVAYLSLLTTSTLVFWLIPGLLKCPIGPIDSLYFSVVTITTLGYGDILPYSAAGKLISSCVAVLGVVLLGFFLVGVANRIGIRQERSIVEAAKGLISSQYGFYRKELALYCIFIANKNQELSLEFTDTMESADAFRKYFAEDDTRQLKEFEKNVSEEKEMVEQILRILESLELHLRQFLSVARISDAELLKQLNRSVSFIEMTRRLNLSIPGQERLFCNRLWTILACWEMQTPHRNSNSLTDAIEKV